MRNVKRPSAVLLCTALLLSGCSIWNRSAKDTTTAVDSRTATITEKKDLTGKTDEPSAAAGAPIGGSAGALIGKKMEKQKRELESLLPNQTKVQTFRTNEALKVTLNSGMLFAPNSSTLSEASKSTLRTLASSLKANPDTDLKVVGYTDNTGKAEYNQILSEKRAKSIRDYLTTQELPASRIAYEGKGANQSIADNNTPEGRSQNRRMELFITANEKMIHEAQQGTLRE